MKKLLKKPCTLALAVIFCLSAMSVPVSAATTTVTSDDGFVFNTQTCKITGYTGDSSSITIPDEIDGYTVAGIEAFALGYCKSITSVTISSHIVSVGYGAFYDCTSLTDIKVDGASSYYTSVDGVLFNKKMTELVAYPAGKAQASYTISDGVTSIDGSAFFDNPYLSSVTVPDGVKKIEALTFDRCTGLVSITLPDGITSIGQEAFSMDAKLKSVKIPDSVTSIEGGAFSGCTSLGTAVIPKAVTSIGDGAFSSSASDIEVDAYNDDFASENGVLFNKNMTALMQYPAESSDTDYTVPDSVTEICNCAFSGCANLKSVTISDGVTVIGDYAFSSCANLESVTISDSVASIGQEAFENCKALDYVIISKKVTELKYSTFAGCTSLKSIIIPGSVKEIGAWAFDGCKSLKYVTIKNGVMMIDADAFADCTVLEEIELPSSISFVDVLSVSNCTDIEVDSGNTHYCSKDGVLFSKDMTTLVQYPVKSTRTSYTIPDNVTTISESAFRDCTTLTSVTIPDSAVKISLGAFCGCTGLTSVTIPSSVMYIGESAFDCANLTDISVDGGSQYFTSVDGVLFNKDKTTLVQYPAGIDSTDYTIPNSVTAIGSGAFLGCSNLKLITIPSSVTSIGTSAFNADVTLNVTSGSYGETYAQTYEYNYVKI